MIPVSQTYQYLITQFTEEKIKERFQFIEFECLSIVERFSNSENLDLKGYFNISHLIIEEVVINYFADIDRLKKFHGIEFVNSIKIAAYTCYWLSRLKPMQMVKLPDRNLLNEKRKLFFQINEKIAFGIMMGIAFDQKIQTEIFPETLDFYRSTIYTLTYRTNTPQLLELILQSHIAVPSNPVAFMED